MMTTLEPTLAPESKTEGEENLILIDEDAPGGRQTGGGTFDPAELKVGYLDFNEIVDEAANRYELACDVRVKFDARQELIQRAKDHEPAVVEAMKREGLTPADLVDAAYKQFEEAHRAQERPGMYITAEHVRAGMKRKCWFLGWC
jgi:hypothetical protein